MFSEEIVTLNDVNIMRYFYLSLFRSVMLFDGNTDANQEVYIDLENVTRPLLARHVRLHTVTWHRHISLRFDVHGCQYFEEGIQNQVSTTACSRSFIVSLIGKNAHTIKFCSMIAFQTLKQK